MIISKYGIRLKRIKQDDLELLREWRNSENVKKYMEFREHITPEMQQQWFETVNNYNNFYYIIEHKEVKIGVINEKNVDREGKGTSESGIYIALEKYRNTHIPVLASLMLIEISMFLLDGRESYIRILNDNHESINYNTSIGYELCEGQEELENQLYVMTKESFEQKTAKIRKAARRLCEKEYPNGYIILEPQDYETGIAQEHLKLINNHRIKSHFKEVKEGTLFYY